MYISLNLCTIFGLSNLPFVLILQPLCWVKQGVYCRGWRSAVPNDLPKRSLPSPSPPSLAWMLTPSCPIYTRLVGFSPSRSCSVLDRGNAPRGVLLGILGGGVPPGSPNHVIFHTRFFNKSLEEERLDCLTYCLEFSFWERLKSSRWRFPYPNTGAYNIGYGLLPNTNSLRFSEVSFFTFHSPG